jgi:hypothetical protein
MLPGLNQRRLLNLMRAAIDRCRLDLRGATVLTEAASGAYIITPVLATMAGADHVFAVTRSTKYGTLDEISTATNELALAAECAGRIEVIPELSSNVVGRADIVTNSGHVRPIDARLVRWMKPTAVVPLMYEAWEFRNADLDLDACRRRNIRVAGTNERHPAVDVFSFLGVMAVKLLLDAGVSVYTSNVLVLCDNPFAPFIENGLTSAGAAVQVTTELRVVAVGQTFDAILVAMHPQKGPVIDSSTAQMIASNWPGAVVAQFWGDIDRDALSSCRVPFWPSQGPAAGHMAILPSGVGADPIIRLQSGGLKVGEILLKQQMTGEQNDWDFVDEL